jgi:AcrR family transcriptional regulator
VDRVVHSGYDDRVVARVLEPGRREEILGTAAREFATAGYERASLNRIIRTCRMSKSSFYHYFDSKAALFDAVVREAMKDLAREVTAPSPAELAGPAFWDTITRTVHRVLELATRDGWHADAGRLFYLPDAPLEHSPAARETVDALRTWAVGALEVGRSCGAVRTDLPIALQASLAADVVQSLDRWALEHSQEYRDADARATLAGILTDAIRRLLATTSETAGLT